MLRDSRFCGREAQLLQALPVQGVALDCASLTSSRLHITPSRSHGTASERSARTASGHAYKRNTGMEAGTRKARSTPRCAKWHRFLAGYGARAPEQSVDEPE